MSISAFLRKSLLLPKTVKSNASFVSEASSIAISKRGSSHLRARKSISLISTCQGSDSKVEKSICMPVAKPVLLSNISQGVKVNLVRW